MRPLFSSLLAWQVLLSPTLLAWSDTPAGATKADTQAEAARTLDRGLDLERARNWSGAMEVYRSALDRWPGRVELSRRLRLCEIHYKLHRRYADQSFRNVLLRLPSEQAIDLYDEVLERIQMNYVDAVPFEPLARHGLDNLEVALRDPVFVKANADRSSGEQVLRLRESLKKLRSELHTPDRASAVQAAVLSAQLAQGIGLDATPVYLEFIYGACDALDDFTSYLTPDKLEDLYAMIDGNFVGLGVELKIDPKGLRLVGVIRGGPAWDAGVKVGEWIVQVDGRSVKGLSLDEAANRLSGSEGSQVEVGVDKGDGKVRSLRLIRRHVDVESVVGAKLVDVDSGIGYMQLSGFQKTSTEELDRAITALVNQGMQVLVLDLRGNPGGLLNVAVEIADRFLDAGLIVSTRGRASGQSQAYSASGRPRWRFPLYVLVDHDSASASEILAGALQDHHRGVILGSRTYGKGSVQSIFSLRSAPAGLKLTTAKFYSPLDRPYSEQGVSPDIPIQTRTAAKPANGSTPAAIEPVMGDPQLDTILAAAIRAAKEQQNAKR